MIRMLDQVQREIDDAYADWHRLVRKMADGQDVTPEITDLETRIEQLFAEKRWLKAGGVVVDMAKIAEIERRTRMSLGKGRGTGVLIAKYAS